MLIKKKLQEIMFVQNSFTPLHAYLEFIEYAQYEPVLFGEYKSHKLRNFTNLNEYL